MSRFTGIFLLVLMCQPATAELGCGDIVPDSNTVLSQNYVCDGEGFIGEYGLEVFDCAGHSITGNGSGAGFNASVADGVTIKNCVISNFERGISLYESNNATLINNTLTGNDYGVVVQRSTYVAVNDSNISLNQYSGLYTDNKSFGARLVGNYICFNNQTGGQYYDLHNWAPTLDEPAQPPKVVEHAGIDIAPYNATTMLAGSVEFDPVWNTSGSNRVFSEFGVYDPNVSANIFGEWDYLIDEDAPVYVMLNGTVTFAQYQESTNDYEIYIVPTGHPDFILNTDHVRDATVSVNDTVTAGDLLGYASPWANFSDFETPAPDPSHLGQMVGMIEFTYLRGNYGICPSALFTNSLLSEFNQSILQLASDWEAFIGSDSIHDQDAWILPGCLSLEFPTSYSTTPTFGDNNTCNISHNHTDQGASSGCDFACGQPPLITTTTSTSSTTSTIIPSIPYEEALNLTAGNSTFINASSLNVTLEIVSGVDINNTHVAMESISKNSVNDTFPEPSFDRFIRIGSDEVLEDNLVTAVLRLYYTDAELTAANLLESSLEIYTENEENETWEPLNASAMDWVLGTRVDSAGNFVEANLTEFGTFIVAGDSIGSESQFPLSTGWNLISIPLLI